MAASMGRLYRPPIPDSVKVMVAQRQLRDRLPSDEAIARVPGQTLANYLLMLLDLLAVVLDCPVKDLRLDHNPALGVRQKMTAWKTVRGTLRTITKYKPDANDPDHLIYRTAHDHHIKTNVRGDGAQFSDTVLMKRERRRNKPAKKPSTLSGRPKQKIPSRKNAWPKGRKIRSRTK